MSFREWRKGKYSARAVVMDESLAEHDAKYHPDGFDPEKDECKLRESMAKEGAKDDLRSGEETSKDEELVNVCKATFQKEAPSMYVEYMHMTRPQQVEVAKKYLVADIAEREKKNFLSKHMSLDENNRKVFDSKESRREAKRLTDSSVKKLKEAFKTFEKIAWANCEKRLAKTVLEEVYGL